MAAMISVSSAESRTVSKDVVCPARFNTADRAAIELQKGVSAKAVWIKRTCMAYQASHEDEVVARLMGADLAEQARILTDWGWPSTGLLILMSPCENRCYFCAQPAVTHPPRRDWTPIDRVRSLLAGNRTLGLERLCIGGTEPVSHPDFRATLKLAHQVGFSQIELMTSGLRLAERGVAADWARAGVTRVAIPIYSADAAVHDRVCGTTCHGRLLAGLDAAHAAGLQISLHTLALAPTLAGLSALADLCQTRWQSTLSLAPARPKDGVWDFEREAPSLADVTAAIAGIPRTGLHMMGWPLCFAPARQQGGATVMSIYFRGQTRTHPSVCDRCELRAACAGLVRALFERDGDAGLTANPGKPGPLMNNS